MLIFELNRCVEAMSDSAVTVAYSKERTVVTPGFEFGTEQSDDSWDRVGQYHLPVTD
jgi:hypothetical protein